jgi:hypothetical protein
MCRDDGSCLSLASGAACVSIGSIVEGIGGKGKKKMRLCAFSCGKRSFDFAQDRRAGSVKRCGGRLEAVGRRKNEARSTGDGSRATGAASTLLPFYASTRRGGIGAYIPCTPLVSRIDGVRRWADVDVKFWNN